VLKAIGVFASAEGMLAMREEMSGISARRIIRNFGFTNTHLEYKKPSQIDIGCGLEEPWVTLRNHV
jgi:hypothetical protein